MSNTFSQSMQVPAQNSADNILMNHVIGNKTDDQVGAVSNIASQIAYLKWLMITNDVIGADAVSNANMRDPIGNKTDTEQASVVDTASLMRYQKAEIQELHQRTVPQIGADSNVADNTYEDVVNITDKGVLTGIWVEITGENNADPGDGSLLINIDGGGDVGLGLIKSTKTSHDAGINVNYFGYGSYSFNHRFDTSLRVQHKKSEANGTIRTTVLYTTE